MMSPGQRRWFFEMLSKQRAAGVAASSLAGPAEAEVKAAAAAGVAGLGPRVKRALTYGMTKIERRNRYFKKLGKNSAEGAHETLGHIIDHEDLVEHAGDALTELTAKPGVPAKFAVRKLNQGTPEMRAFVAGAARYNEKVINQAEAAKFIRKPQVVESRPPVEVGIHSGHPGRVGRAQPERTAISEHYQIRDEANIPRGTVALLRRPRLVYVSNVDIPGKHLDKVDSVRLARGYVAEHPELRRAAYVRVPNSLKPEIPGAHSGLKVLRIRPRGGRPRGGQ